MEEEKLPIVFAYWKDDELMGFRADTFGTISMNQPKIYSYSEAQVATVLKNTRDTISNAGSHFMKVLEKNGFVGNEHVAHSLSTEDTLRSWGKFELRVHPFIDRETAYDELLLKVAIDNLKAPIEIHKFQVLANEN